MRYLNRFLLATSLVAASASLGAAQVPGPNFLRSQGGGPLVAPGGGLRSQGGGPLGGGPRGGPGGSLASQGGGPLRGPTGSYQPGSLPGATPQAAYPGWYTGVGGDFLPANPALYDPTAVSQPGSPFTGGFPAAVGQTVGTVINPTGALPPAGGAPAVGITAGVTPGVRNGPAFPGNVNLNPFGPPSPLTRPPAAAGFATPPPAPRVPGATVVTLAPARP